MLGHFHIADHGREGTVIRDAFHGSTLIVILENTLIVFFEALPQR